MNNDVVLGSNETGELNDELNGEIIFQIEPIMNEMLLKIVSDMNKTPNSFLNDSSCFAGDSTPNQFSLVNTCDSCATQDSVFWRRVARTKIVCNKCFFSQIYLLLFKETKENHETSPQQLPDQDEQEQPVRKKTRASLKNIANTSNNKSYNTTNNQLLDCLNDTTDIKNPASNASSTTSSCSNKTANNEIKMELDLEEQLFNMPRKSTRFTSNNKSKKNENKSKKQSPKTDETQSDKASPTTSPDLFPAATIETKVAPTQGTKSRRTKLFKSEKSPPVKGQVLMSTIFTSEFVFHRGFYMQVGDIVALFDEADEAENTPYFAQIRAFLTDQYGEKSAVLTWLIPINSSYVNLIRAPKDFNPDMFVLGKSYV